MPRSPMLARDAALHRMRRINRWLVAGALVVTGLLTDVAAQAFPGRTIKRAAGTTSTPKAVPATTHTARHHGATHHALTPPAAAPQPQVSEPVPGATSNTGNTGNTGNTANTANTGNTGNTANTGNTGTIGNSGNTGAPAPAQPAPVQAAPAPIVSGGS